MSIEVPQAVFEGILAVRDSGATNMLDRTRVIELLDQMGFDEASEWVKQNKKLYSHGIFQGFQVTEEAKSYSGGEA